MSQAECLSCHPSISRRSVKPFMWQYIFNVFTDTHLQRWLKMQDLYTKDQIAWGGQGTSQKGLFSIKALLITNKFDSQHCRVWWTKRVMATSPFKPAVCLRSSCLRCLTGYRLGASTFLCLLCMSSCSRCTDSRFPCTWCVERNVCTNTRELCASDTLITGRRVSDNTILQ